MTHDENRISDLIDGGLHEKSAIDRAKYELHMRQKAAIEEAAKNDTGGWYEQQAFIRGAQHVIEHPERYGLTSADAYKECFEQFIPEDKWDEATSFLSSYGNGLAKELQKKEI